MVEELHNALTFRQLPGTKVLLAKLLANCGKLEVGLNGKICEYFCCHFKGPVLSSTESLCPQERVN